MLRAHPFTIDRHLRFGVNIQAFHFGDIRDVLHICGVAACTEDARHSRFWVHIVRRYESAGGVVDKGCKIYGKLLYKGRQL